jgi:hypothetical protein
LKDFPAIIVFVFFLLLLLLPLLFCVQFGPNQIPVVSIAVMSAISLIFVFIGQLNVLSTITAIPFMLTYVAVNYAHFTLQMSDELKRQRTAIAAASDKGKTVFFLLASRTASKYASLAGGSKCRVGVNTTVLSQPES